MYIDTFIDLRYYSDTNNKVPKYTSKFYFLHWYFLLIYLLILLIYLLVLDIILIRITRGLEVYKQILFFTLILFIDLFIDLRYYFDINNKVPKCTSKFYFLHWYFLLSYLLIYLFVDLRSYFDTNNEGLTVYKQVLLFRLILFIDLFINFIDLRFYFNTNKRV